MKNLFDPATAEEVKSRVQTLTPASPRQWGTMTPAQALAHCSVGIDMALGTVCPPRHPLGLVFGSLVKPKMLRDDQPMRKNSPTSPTLIVHDDRDLDAEKLRLSNLIDRLLTDGPTACTTHPHPFFGPLTPTEWSILMYKHLDHHLRQFGA